MAITSTQHRLNLIMRHEISKISVSYIESDWLTVGERGRGRVEEKMERVRMPVGSVILANKALREGKQSENLSFHEKV